MSASDEARELRLVNNVEFRLAQVAGESRLESELGKYIVPLMLKLVSPHAAVQRKVWLPEHRSLIKVNLGRGRQQKYAPIYGTG